MDDVFARLRAYVSYALDEYVTDTIIYDRNRRVDQKYRGETFLKTKIILLSVGKYFFSLLYSVPKEIILLVYAFNSTNGVGVWPWAYEYIFLVKNLTSEKQ